MLDNDQTREKLQDVLSQTMEDAAFIFTEPPDEDLEEEDEVVEAMLSFDGTREGVVRLSVPYPLSIELAANLLGLEPEDPDVAEMGESAVGEFLNIFAGPLMESLFGVEDICGLGAPEVRLISSATARANRQDSFCSVCLLAEDEYRIDSALHFGKQSEYNQLS